MVDGIGRVLGDRYRLTALIGTGASASVYLADDRKLGRRVAVKVLHPSLVDDLAFLRRFREEARSAAKLNHPGLMAVYDTDEDDAGPYLVLEFLGGGSLRGLLDAGHRLSVSQVAAVGLEAAQALERAHAEGIVHRDIKPANLLFGTDGRLRIADFGLARALSESGFTDHGDRMVGTARYAAPEQARGVRVDGKADVYALGLVLVECLTGTVPLVREGPVETLMARLDTPVPVPAELGPLVPLLERMGRPDPAERPGAGEVVDALLALTPTLARPEPLPLVGVALAAPDDDELTVLPGDDRTGLLPQLETAPALDRRGRRRRLLLAALVALFVLAGGGVAAAMWATSRPPTYPLPDVSNRSVEEARDLLNQAQTAAKDVKWKIVERHDYSRTTALGGVISQNPSSGTSLRDGGTVTLVVSDGQPLVNMPAVSGKNVADASALLKTARLVPGTVVEEVSEDVPKGTVLTVRVGQTRDVARAPEQTVVDLIVSSGPAPRTVPTVAGKTEAEATAAILAVQLKGVSQQVFSDLPVGAVVSTSPPAGTAVERDSTVTISVSKGPDLVTVPDVTGQKAAAAIDALEKAGLNVTAQFGPPNGKVLNTSPTAGTKVKRGTNITIFFQP